MSNYPQLACTRVEGFDIIRAKILFSLAHSIFLVSILEKWGMESFSTVETFLKVPRDCSFTMGLLQ